MSIIYAGQSQTLDDIEEQIKEANSQKEIADLYYKQGCIESSLKNFQSAIKCFEDAQKIYLEEEQYSQIILCLLEIAINHYFASPNRLIRAFTILNDAKFLAEKNKVGNYNALMAKLYHYQGLINYYEQVFSEALKHYKKALEFTPDNTIEYAKIMDSFALYYLRINNFQIAENYLNKAVKIKINKKQFSDLSYTYTLLGRYYNSLENYDEALTVFYKSLKFILKYKNYQIAARIYDEIAKIYLNQGLLNKSFKASKKAIKYALKTKNPVVLAFSKITKVECIIASNESFIAKNTINLEILPIFKEHSNQRGLILVKELMAKIYVLDKKYAKAIEIMHEVAEFYRQFKHCKDLIKSYIKLSELYKLQRKTKMQVSILTEAIDLAKTNNLSFLLQKLEDLLYDVDKSEWSVIVNKNAKKEKSSDNKTLIDAIDIVSSLSNAEIQTNDPLVALLRIGRSIAAETDIDTLIQIIAEETKMALMADRCTVFMLDKNTDELWSKIALGLNNKEIRFPASTGLAGHVSKTGDTINIKDAYNDDRFNKEIDQKTGYKTKTILCMPIRSINHEIVGVFQVLNKDNDKPFNEKDEELLVAIGSSAGIALENARLFKEQQAMLEDQKKSFNSFVNTLAASIDARDKITSGHSLRVKLYAKTLAEHIRLSNDEIEAIEYAANLHDIGKIGIKDKVLCKEGKLTPEEYEHIQQHVVITNDILNKMYFQEKFKDVPIIASSHHEKYDGTGYFRGLKGEDIHLGGRILAIADVFDAITSKRHYRDRMPIFKVLDILMENSDKHFDGKLIKNFFEITVDKILAILATNNGTQIWEEDIEILKNYSMLNLYNEYKRENNNCLLVQVFEKYYIFG